MTHPLTQSSSPPRKSRARNVSGCMTSSTQLVIWENIHNEALLRKAHAEIAKSSGGSPPPILEPFAGGGSIPVEAQRLGLEVYASDLNPVAVSINKALTEIPPKWADHLPVYPARLNRLANGRGRPA